MDKYEYKIREEEIKELIAHREFEEAAEVADTIDWRRVKSVKMLCMVSDVYKKMRRYEDSRDMLLLAYDRHPGGRTIVYSLCELAIKMGDLGQALEYCKEFIQIAPKDPGRYILQYKLYEAQEVGLEERIAVLEELKKKDYREKWAYELAYMYHLIGMESKCVEECDELILWFGEGKYVIKAMELKQQHQPLSPQQQEKYDSFFRQEEEAQEQVEETIPEDVMAAQTTRVPVEDIDIQVKTLGLSKCDTINLQAEVAAGLKEFLEQDGQQPVYEEDAPTRRMTMPKGKVVDWATAEMVTSEIIADVATVTMGQQPATTQPVPEVVEEVVEADHVVEAVEEIIEATQDTAETWNEVQVEVAEETTVVEEAVEAIEESVREVVEETIEETKPEVLPETLDWQAQEREEAEQMVLPITANVPNLGSVEPPKEMAKVLSMEGDGQISFVMPETVALEKQITGQMNFNDIMLEWERMKLELEEKRKETVRQRVLRDTDSMFTEFEASVRDGLLEQLENGKSMEEILHQAENLDSIQIESKVADIDEADETDEFEAALDAVEDFTDIEDIPEATEEFEELEAVEELPEEVAVAETEEIPKAVEEFEELEEIEESESVEETEKPEDAEESVEEVLEDAEEALDIVEEFVEEVEEDDGHDEEDSDKDEEERHYADDSEDNCDEEDSEENPEDDEADARDDEEDRDEDSDVSEKTSSEGVVSRTLTKEQKELFAPFIQGRESREQLIQALDVISLAAYTGNVVITGREGLDTIGLAKSLIREVQQNDNNFSGKVAKISGASLNKRDVEEIMSGLVNGALIIQKAGEINETTAKKLYKLLQQENRGIIVILEGTKRALNTFFEKYQLLESCFNARIDMEALSDDALVAFAAKYAREQECSIDEFGMLALHRTIAERQTSDHAVTVLEVKEIMDDAIASANRKTIGHFFSILAAKRYDDEDMIIIRENDFM